VGVIEVKSLLNTLFIFLVIILISGCSNSKCEKIIQEVNSLEVAAKNKFDKGMLPKTTTGEGYDVTVSITSLVEEEFKYEMKLIARMIVNNESCFDALRVAEAQELISGE
jgi:hypothetical protein